MLRTDEFLHRHTLGGVLLLACLFCPLTGAAQESKPLTARTLDPVAQPGDEVVVEVVIGSASNPVGEILGTGFELGFNEGALSFKDHQVGALFASNHPDNTLEVGPRVGGGAVDYSVTLFNVSSPPTNVAGGEVVRLRFEVKSDAEEGNFSFSLSNAQRSTSSQAGIDIQSEDLTGGDLEVAEHRRGERTEVRPGEVQDGQAEADFRDSGLLTVDFASLGASTHLTVVRDGNPLGGTALPDIGGSSGERATNSFWELSQTGTSSFEADVCFGLSDLAVATPDEAALEIVTRAGPNESWSEVSSELRPTTDPTEICATGLQSFSQFTVAAPQGHSRTVAGTDGTGNDTGWRLLGLPAGAARSTLEEDLSFELDSGHLLHSWEGGSPNSWTAVTSSSTQLARGKGFIIYFFDDSVDPLTASGITLDLPAAGEDQGADVPVSGLSTNNRFHLMGNPYEEAFDLSNLVDGNGDAFSSAGFQATVMVWDPSIPGWRAVVEDPGSSADQIAAWQGFFIERTSTGQGPTSLTFEAAGKQGGSGDLIGSKVLGVSAEGAETSSAQVELGLTVTSGADTVAGDGAKVLFIEGANAGWDAYDASQLPPPNASSYATLSSPMERDDDLTRRLQASRAYPTTTDTVTVPLSVRSVQTGGAARLGWPEEKRAELPDGWTVELEDTQTGEWGDLRKEEYEFDLSTGDGEALSAPGDARFRLHVVPSSAIPVALVGFEARLEDKAVHLRWQTASETSNAGFAVQRRAGEGAQGGGGAWTEVGFVEGGETTPEATRYRFTDANLPFTADALEYRLRQVDTDGSETLSRTVTVRRGAPEKLALQAPFPNPAARQATLRFAVPEATIVQIGVYDLLGRQVATVAEGRLEAGRHERRLDTGAWATGTYFLRLEAGAEVRTRKLTVLR